ncbi:MAG: acyl-CoA dehydrogenase [Pseudonocardiales bacterium]|nr:MAG: acyl-CoA dehydrogenase [Pseudonocardiales bacterium]
MVQGINETAVTPWLTSHVDVLAAPLSYELISGGRSNLTYAVTGAGGRTVVLRRPPTSHVLSTAHDMAREYRVISALRGTDVPVAPALAFCGDEAVSDRPFYVMGFVAGHVLRDVAGTEAVLDEPHRGVAGNQLVDVLAAIHRVDVDAVGLGDFARRDGYLERQLRRWHGQFGKSQEQAKEIGVYRPVPLVDEVHALLTERLPAQQGTAIVHGDYRLTNVMFSPDLRHIAAVVDWEMATLGDPLTDVGLLVVYQTLAADDDFVMPRMSPDDGFLTPQEMVERYAGGSTRSLAALDWYVGLGYFKLAVVAEGIHRRYLQGKTVGTGFDHFGAAVPRLLDAALQSLTTA